MMLFLEKTMLLTPLFLNLLALYFLAVEVIAILFSLKVKGEGNRIKLDKYQRNRGFFAANWAHNFRINSSHFFFIYYSTELCCI